MARAAHRAREAAAGGTARIGTTGRGIGPAYEDKFGRRAVRVCDLADTAYLTERVHALLAYHNVLLRGLGAAEVKSMSYSFRWRGVPTSGEHNHEREVVTYCL